MEIVEQLNLKSELDSICLLEKSIEKIRDTYCISDNRYGDIMLAVVEAVTNAIVHGNGEDVSKWVKVETYKSKDKLRFTIIDEGPGFDAEQVPDPTLPLNIEKMNGRGVFLIKQLADEVAFLEKGTKVELGFYL
jgi:serine/threonine-protein kinase RsbW